MPNQFENVFDYDMQITLKNGLGEEEKQSYIQKLQNKEEIQTLLEEKLKLDRTKTQVEGFTKLDLMELTRKHICSHKG